MIHFMDVTKPCDFIAIWFDARMLLWIVYEWQCFTALRGFPGDVRDSRCFTASVLIDSVEMTHVVAQWK